MNLWGPARNPGRTYFKGQDGVRNNEISNMGGQGHADTRTSGRVGDQEEVPQFACERPGSNGIIIRYGDGWAVFAH